MSYVRRYLDETVAVARVLPVETIEAMIARLIEVKRGGGRLFFLGVGGSAANCSHAVTDFRKIAGFEAYAPTDNVGELTARTNDEGWETVFRAWLEDSRLGPRDAVFVFSVGGGDRERGISANLVHAVEYAREVGATVLGIVGRDGGFTGRVADVCLIIPPQSADTVTPLSESFQVVVWHLLVSDPRLMRTGNKWESVTAVEGAAGAGGEHGGG